MKLLIVEDESSLRELLARALRKEQYVVETASTYAEASDKLAAYSYAGRQRVATSRASSKSG